MARGTPTTVSSLRVPMLTSGGRWLNPSHHTESQVIVARVKIPSTAMFDIVRKLSSGIGEYEAEHGRLTPPPTEAS